MVLIFHIVLLVNCLFVINAFTDCKGFKHCTCSKENEFTCTYTDYIPTPPNYIVKVNLYDNVFPYITRTTFKNITINKITNLIMRKNSIQTITQDAFSDLQYLEKLEISYEEELSDHDLKSAFESLNIKTLTELRLEHNHFENLTDDIFKHFAGAYLTKISLNGNKLRKIGSILKHLTSLDYLYAVENAIAFVETKYLRILKHLDLSNNNVYLVPNFCIITNDNNILVPQMLERLILTDNAIRDLYLNSFDCLDKLETLHICGNRIPILRNNIFSRLPRLTELSLCNMPELKTIESEALKITSLKILSLAQNKLHFDKINKNIPENIFDNLKNLRELDLTNNVFPCNNTPKFMAIFSPLTQLRKLLLTHVGICHIPNNLFKMLPNLEMLNLSGNKISKWNESVFKNVTSLKYLILQGNLIHVINKTSFTWEMLNSIHKLNIADNPFWCTCDQIWFLDTLRSTNLTHKMICWPTRYNCRYPDYLSFTRISNYYPTFTECNLLTIIIVCVSVVSFLMFCIVAIVFRCHVNIRNLLYFIHVYRRMKNGYVRLESSCDYEFDVFIVYCDADRQWVHSDLLQRLETSGSKVCIHHRDFDVGEHITTNIENFMDKSSKILVVMSNKFAESEWCQWEVDLILERRRKQGKDGVILIMCQQIDSLHMTSSLRSLLDTTPHLSLVRGFGEHIFWKTVLKAVNKSVLFPPTAVQ